MFLVRLVCLAIIAILGGMYLFLGPGKSDRPSRGYFHPSIAIGTLALLVLGIFILTWWGGRNERTSSSKTTENTTVATKSVPIAPRARSKIEQPFATTGHPAPKGEGSVVIIAPVGHWSEDFNIGQHSFSCNPEANVIVRKNRDDQLLSKDGPHLTVKRLKNVATLNFQSINDKPVKVTCYLKSVGVPSSTSATSQAVTTSSPTNEGVYRVGGRVSPPVVLYKVDPDFSDEARKAHRAGRVLVQLVVDETGAPRNIIVVESLGLGLDEKAVEAVKKWKFTPGMKDGMPVPVRATIEVNFRSY